MSWLDWLWRLLRPAPMPAPPPAPSPGPIDVTSLVAAINRVRAARGLDRLVENAALSAECYNHSWSMARLGALDHSGFPARIAAVFPGTAAGENVEENSYRSADDCAAQWMGDAGHRANMLGRWHWVGVGVVVDTNGRNWITADFCAA
jgi:uncharacterized protein YkwD